MDMCLSLSGKSNFINKGSSIMAEVFFYSFLFPNINEKIPPE